MSAPIDTPRLTLGPFSEADAPLLLAYRNHPEVARYQSWNELSLDEANELVRSQANLRPGTPGMWSQFAVRLKPHQGLIGDCGLLVDAGDTRLGEIGFTFGRSHQGLGFAAEATAALLQFAFDSLQLHRLKAIVDCRNQAAVRLLERVGFRREGHFRQHTWFKGTWCDEYLYAILASEWQSTLPASRRDA